VVQQDEPLGKRRDDREYSRSVHVVQTWITYKASDKNENPAVLAAITPAAPL
jgi:hypothetical protein